MKKLIVFFALCSIPLCVFSQENRVTLQACVKLCLVMYIDMSGSLDDKSPEICSWINSTKLIPAENGSVEIALLSFADTFTVWQRPTGSYNELEQSASRMCCSIPNGSTFSSKGIMYIKNVLQERKKVSPDEHQIVIYFSDFHMSDDGSDTDQAIDGLSSMVDDGVHIFLANPSPEIIDNGNGDFEFRNPVDLKVKSRFLRSRAKDLGRSYQNFSQFLEDLEPISPCQ